MVESGKILHIVQAPARHSVVSHTTKGKECEKNMRRADGQGDSTNNLSMLKMQAQGGGKQSEGM